MIVGQRPPSLHIGGENDGTSRLARYARQIVLPEIGPRGQKRLDSARVLIVGLGGLGCPAATYLAAAGVGTLTLCDPDAVDVTNLHRQPLFTAADAGRPKAEVAAARLAADFPVRIEPRVQRAGPDSIAALLKDQSVVLDATDDPATKFLLNDAALAHRIPLVHGAALRFEGRVLVVPPGGPCLRCLFDPPLDADSCATAGILGALAGVVGSLMATEALKILTGAGSPLAGRLLCYDALRASFREVRIRHAPDCIGCKDHRKEIAPCP